MIDLAAYKAHTKRTLQTSAGRGVTALNIAQNDKDSLFGDISEQAHGIRADPQIETDDNDNEDPPELRHRLRKLQSLTDTASKNNAKSEALYSQCGYMHEDDTPTDEQVMLCASHVWGYSFREKNWGKMPYHNFKRGINTIIRTLRRWQTLQG